MSRKRTYLLLPVFALLVFSLGSVSFAQDVAEKAQEVTEEVKKGKENQKLSQKLRKPLSFLEGPQPRRCRKWQWIIIT
jgi:hypothetical protein